MPLSALVLSNWAAVALAAPRRDGLRQAHRLLVQHLTINPVSLTASAVMNVGYWHQADLDPDAEHVRS